MKSVISISIKGLGGWNFDLRNRVQPYPRVMLSTQLKFHTSVPDNRGGVGTKSARSYSSVGSSRLRRVQCHMHADHGWLLLKRRRGPSVAQGTLMTLVGLLKLHTVVYT